LELHHAGGALSGGLGWRLGPGCPGPGPALHVGSLARLVMARQAPSPPRIVTRSMHAVPVRPAAAAPWTRTWSSPGHAGAALRCSTRPTRRSGSDRAGPARGSAGDLDGCSPARPGAAFRTGARRRGRDRRRGAVRGGEAALHGGGSLCPHWSASRADATEGALGQAGPGPWMSVGIEPRTKAAPECPSGSSRPAAAVPLPRGRGRADAPALRQHQRRAGPPSPPGGPAGSAGQRG
jgi:hypothetical protein